MKLLSLHIENFGNLQNFDDIFTEGLNARLERNGWGKSTLAVFIKAMLYGLPSSTRRSLLENERKRYTPWQGGCFGGSLDFSLQEKTYRIERTFGVKDSEDTLTVIDLATGKAANTPWASAPGNDIFGVDADAFERSTYFSQRQNDSAAGLSGIQTKLNHLVEATDDLANFDTAMTALDKRRRYYEHLRGEGGRIDEIDREIAVTRQKIEICHTAKETLEQLTASLSQAQTESQEQDVLIRELTKKQAEAIAAQSALTVQNHVDALEKDCQALQTSMQDIHTRLGGSLPSEETLSSLASLIKEQKENDLAISRATLSEEEARELHTLEDIFPATPAEEDLTRLRDAASAVSHAAERVRLTSPISESETALATAQAELPPIPTGSPSIDDLKNLCLSIEGYEKKFASFKAREQLLPKPSSSFSWIFSLILTIFCAGLVFLGLLHPMFYIVFGLLCIVGVLSTIACFKKHSKQTKRYQLKRKSLAIITQRYTIFRENDLATLTAGLDIYQIPLLIPTSNIIPLLEKYEQQKRMVDILAEQARQCAANRAAAKEELLQCEQLFESLFSGLTTSALPEDKDAISAVETLSGQIRRLFQLYALVNTHKEKKKVLAGQYDRIEQSRRALLASFPTVAEDMETALATLTKDRDLYQTLARQYDEKKAELDAFCAENGVGSPAFTETLQKAKGTDLPALSDTLRAAHEQKQMLTARIADLSGRAETQLLCVEELNSLEYRLSALEEEKADALIRLSTITCAEKYLASAKESLSTRYLGTMRERFAEHLSCLLDKEISPKSFTIDTSMNVKLRAGGAGRSLDSFSTGTRDLITFCARLALIDAMFEGEEPFLILDDPFTNLDDPTIAHALTKLHSLAEKYQMIYFTCSESRIQKENK